MEKRLLLLPLAWVVFGLGEVYGLRFLLGAVLGILAVSLYSLGVWNIDLSRRKDKADLGALLVLVIGGLLLWYVPLSFFFVVAAIVYLLAVNIE